MLKQTLALVGLTFSIVTHAATIQLNAFSTNLSNTNYKESWNGTGPGTIYNTPQGNITMGSSHAEYSNVGGGTAYHPDSVTQVSTGFADFDANLGNIVGATLNFNFYSYAYNKVESLEWHGSSDNNWAAGGSSSFDFASLVAMTGTSNYTWAAERRMGAPTAGCSTYNGTGDVRFYGIGDGDDNYCRDTAGSSNGWQSISVAVSSDYFDDIENGDFSLLLKSHIYDWDTYFWGGDDRRYARAQVQTSISGASLSVDYAVAPVPVPAAAWLFGSALIGLAGIKRKK